MNPIIRTAGTKRLLTAVSLATLWVAGTAVAGSQTPEVPALPGDLKEIKR